MIPKIIHYCWFGRNEKSEKIKFCMDSWKKYLPDYEIIEWNEDNFHINEIKYVNEAYDKKKWAFVTDYVRAYALYKKGGIYLDTDVEITGNLDTFLTHGAFSGFESKGYPFTALWGANKGHHWPKKVLDFCRRTVVQHELIHAIHSPYAEKQGRQPFSFFMVRWPPSSTITGVARSVNGKISSSRCPSSLQINTLSELTCRSTFRTSKYRRVSPLSSPIRIRRW